MEEAKGNRALAAAALGITVRSLSTRISGNPQLRAIYGKSHENDPGGPPVMNERDTMFRDPLALPAGAAEPSKLELIDLVQKADWDLHRAKLGKLGLPVEVLDRIKELEGLAQSTAHMLAISLELSHRDYHVTGLQLSALLDTMFRRLMAKKEELGFIESNEERAFLMKVYIEGVKERGNAFTRMLTGTQAMVQMAEGSQDAITKGNRRKPGFVNLVQPDKP